MECKLSEASMKYNPGFSKKNDTRIIRDDFGYSDLQPEVMFGFFGLGFFGFGFGVQISGNMPTYICASTRKKGG